MSKWTMKSFSILVIFTLLNLLNFSYIYLSDQLYKFSDLWGDVYWIATGLIGIIIGIIGVISLGSRMLFSIISILEILWGFGLLALLFLALGITSM
ncbi:hypothetical protein FHS19_000038 [Paenibacillus rhizosphaerae]|uniref:Uncharacterized protein n=1 Tax=Paenibacillus rhizosphaerae TaxID=297318 RepID=A0A839TFR6_9BACL|nr:hypothetical protein [Paenibacillus rhizosphaerae]